MASMSKLQLSSLHQQLNDALLCCDTDEEYQQIKETIRIIESWINK